MNPLVLALFAITCTTAPTPTTQAFPSNYAWPEDCLVFACPNTTAAMNDLKSSGKKLKLNDVLDLGYMSKWHAAQCNGKG